MMMDSKERLSRKLDQLERLARGNRRGRLLHRPVRYFRGQFFQKVVYPFRQSGRLVKAPTFWGQTMRLLLPAAMDIYLLGGKTHDSELRLTRFLIRRLRPGDQVADIGAHFGFFSLLAAELTGPTGRVAAFEASADTFEILARNSEELAQVQAFHRAVSDTAGSMDFYEFDPLHTEYNTLRPEQFEGQPWFDRHPPRRQKVLAITFDAFCRENDFRPDFIKIDVEGAEDKVIAGMEQLLSAARPALIMEYLAEARLNEPHRRATRRLLDLGYRPHYIAADGRLAPCPDIEERLRATGLDSDNLAFIAD